MRTRLLALALLLFTAAPAFAHAFLDHSSPAVGSTVPASPPTLKLWFTQELEPAFSTVAVTDASGADVEAGAAAVDAKDASLLEVPLKKLPAGTYTVKWRVISVDTHPTDGSFTFSVGGP